MQASWSVNEDGYAPRRHHQHCETMHAMAKKQSRGWPIGTGANSFYWIMRAREVLRNVLPDRGLHSCQRSYLSYIEPKAASNRTVRRHCQKYRVHFVRELECTNHSQCLVMQAYAALESLPYACPYRWTGAASLANHKNKRSRISSHLPTDRECLSPSGLLDLRLRLLGFS